MKALVKAKDEIGLVLSDVNVPKIGNDDVLIKVKTTAICGTDLHIWNWDNWASSTIKTPMTVGHEFMGEVFEVGPDVKNFQIGDRVSAESHITGQNSRNAKAGKLHLDPETVNIGVDRDGAFAEFISVPARNVVNLPDSISDQIGSILDPFGNAVHATLSYDLVGEDVLVTGAGPIGIMSAAIAKYVGARKVLLTDINDHRLELAKKVCDVEVLNPLTGSLEEKMTEMGIKEGFDIGLEMSGNSNAFNDLIKNMYNGGRVALLGLLPNNTQINWDDVIFKGLNIKGIYGREMFETWYKMTQMIRSGLDISKVLTHKFLIDDYKSAFDVIQSGKCGKVVLLWE